jgi:hypothetical protein
MILFDSDGNCTESCGWMAAMIAALAYGTYGVPIKETKKIPVHPLVFQSYKTLTMFLCCWLVLLMGVPFSFTYWGILSGLFWVLGGTGGIVAVRYAGMALAVGTWASVMICVNFVWGILIFEEPVANMYGTAIAFVLLAIGLVGMSKYSEPTTTAYNKQLKQQQSSSHATLCQADGTTSPEKSVEYENNTTSDDIVDQFMDEDAEQQQQLNDRSVGSEVLNHMTKLVAAPWGSFQNLARVCSAQRFLADNENVPLVSQPNGKYVEDELLMIDSEYPATSTSATTSYGSIFRADCSTTSLVSPDKDDDVDIEDVDVDIKSKRSHTNEASIVASVQSLSSSYDTNEVNCPTVMIGGYVFQKRNVGIASAVFNGIMTGTSFIPVHYAKAFGFGGAHYMISYAVGAVISNIVLWLLYISYLFITTSKTTTTVCDSTQYATTTFRARIGKTYDSLPKLYLQQLWFPGFMAGTYQFLLFANLPVTS